MPSPEDYTVGLICPQSIEYTAAQCILDDEHDTPPVLPHNFNVYTAGRIGRLNVVIATPAGSVTDSLERVTIDMLRSFPNIGLCLMVGTGGAVPRQDHDLRLGDVVVSAYANRMSGVAQLDFGKKVGGIVQVERASVTSLIPPFVSAAISVLAARHERLGNQIDERIKGMFSQHLRLSVRFHRPSPSTDKLFKPDATHDVCCKEDACSSDASNHISRRDRGPEDNVSQIHYGTIGLGDILLKNAIARDQLATKEDDILCLASGAGLGINPPLQIICGICNYSDSHCSREWQPYAAMAAAVYARDLLNQIRQVDLLTENILRGFALRIGGEQETLGHFETMKFLHGKRKDISQEFERYYLRDSGDEEASSRRKSDAMSFGDKVASWQMEDAKGNEELDPEPYVDNTADDGDMNPDMDDESHFESSEYHGLVKNSIAFQWLISRLYREANMTTSDASSMEKISTKIRDTFYAQKENCIISSLKGPPRCSMTYGSDWKPLVFFAEEKYTVTAEDALVGSIVLVRDGNNVEEALTCSDYITRTWKFLGEDFLHLTKHVLRSNSGSKCSVALFDQTNLTGWLESQGNFKLEVSGNVEAIAEVGELYGWLTTALRSARADRVAIAEPEIHIDADIRNQSRAPIAKFTIRYSDDVSRSTGQCWMDLFRNPVVVHGFPVRRRGPNTKPGLEVTLPLLSALLRTRQIAIFCGKAFLKGFCTILVPTDYDEDIVHWHVLFNEDGSRFSFSDPRALAITKDFNLATHLTVTDINNARHVVGWCAQALNFAGSKNIDHVRKTQLEAPSSYFALDRVAISGGKIVTAGISVAVGKKDKPVRLENTSDYHQQVLDMGKKTFVLFDCEDRRAWLVNGSSVLLHLVRASIASRREDGQTVLFQDDDIIEAESPYEGKISARAVLLRRENMDLKVYEKWNRPVEETVWDTTAEEGEGKTTIKRQTEWYHFADEVGKIYETLQMLHDIQTDASTTDGYKAKIKMSPRRHLAGWDFTDVVDGVGAIFPKEEFLKDVGLGWVDLVRAIDAVTLFGKGFGQIIKPQDANLTCAAWGELPLGRDLLATTIPVIKDIMKSSGYGPASEPCWKLFTDYYWHQPDQLFEVCKRGAACRCDRVQVLLPEMTFQLRRRFNFNARSPSLNLSSNGAVIFGHSYVCPLKWTSTPESPPTLEGQAPGLENTAQASNQSNSILETDLSVPENGSTPLTTLPSGNSTPVLEGSGRWGLNSQPPEQETVDKGTIGGIARKTKEKLRVVMSKGKEKLISRGSKP